MGLLQIIAALEALQPAGGIYNTPGACVERMALTAHLHLKAILGSTGIEGIATGT
jgi:hypothetical protein